MRKCSRIRAGLVSLLGLPLVCLLVCLLVLFAAAGVGLAAPPETSRHPKAPPVTVDDRVSALERRIEKLEREAKGKDVGCDCSPVTGCGCNFSGNPDECGCGMGKTSKAPGTVMTAAGPHKVGAIVRAVDGTYLRVKPDGGFAYCEECNGPACTSGSCASPAAAQPFYGAPVFGGCSGGSCGAPNVAGTPIFGGVFGGGCSGGSCSGGARALRGIFRR